MTVPSPVAYNKSSHIVYWTIALLFFRKKGVWHEIPSKLSHNMNLNVKRISQPNNVKWNKQTKPAGRRFCNWLSNAFPQIAKQNITAPYLQSIWRHVNATPLLNTDPNKSHTQKSNCFHNLNVEDEIKSAPTNLFFENVQENCHAAH